MAIGAEFSASASAQVSIGLGTGAGAPAGAKASAPLIPFRFQLRFRQSGAGAAQGSEVDMCQGAFAECTGLEATMEPKVIRSGGVNHAAFQRAGQVTHATVILKRGMTDNRHLWKWFAMVSGGDYAARMNVDIDMLDGAGTKVIELVHDVITIRTWNHNSHGNPFGVVQWANCGGLNTRCNRTSFI